jgi:tetratricopeptide (TPR) repeat protein
LVEEKLHAKSGTKVNIIIKLLGFCLSTTIIYFMVIWTVQLSKVEIEDLPVISVLNKDFKIPAAENSHDGIENLDLSINTLKEGNFLEDYNDYKPLNTIEPELLNNEKAVSSDMENQLQNSINLALKSLENQEIITSDKSFYLYLGSFESAENADKKLLAVKKIDDLNLVTNFSIKKNMNNTINNYSVISNNYFFYEKALDHCEVVLKHNLDCKIISDI